MILVDANVLLYARFVDFSQHERAHRWLDAQLNARHRVGLPWPSLLAFLRLATNPRVFASPLSADAAWQQVRDWLQVPSVWVPIPTAQHPETLATLIRQTQATGKLIPDAHLAALAVEHQLVLCTTDGDFARFPSLRWENPLG